MKRFFIACLIMAISFFAFAGNKTLLYVIAAKPVSIQFQQEELNVLSHKKSVKAHCNNVCCKKMLRLKQNKLAVL